MSNYHLNVGVISRAKGGSITRSVSYICGRNLRDSYSGKHFYNYRNDVLYNYTFLPNHAPPIFYNLQVLCNAIDQSERYVNARTARVFKCSLPNELEIEELKVTSKNPLKK